MIDRAPKSLAATAGEGRRGRGCQSRHLHLPLSDHFGRYWVPLHIEDACYTLEEARERGEVMKCLVQAMVGENARGFQEAEGPRRWN